MGVNRVPNTINRNRMVMTPKKHSIISLPDNGPKGQPITAQPITPHNGDIHIVQNHMTVINNNTTIINNVNNYNTRETQVNHYYWHSYGGFNYCHYYDPWGYHWYGWYVGGSCFWTRYYGNRWWWYDGDDDRWCYWYNGFWWWQDPVNVSVVYVYNNGDYTPATSSETVVQADTNDQSGGSVFFSPDGTRKVRIVGDDRDAILYDTADTPSFKPVYLTTGVQDVKFSNTRNGAPLQIVLTVRDGSFEMFDGYGNPFNGSNQ